MVIEHDMRHESSRPKTEKSLCDLESKMRGRRTTTKKEKRITKRTTKQQHNNKHKTSRRHNNSSNSNNNNMYYYALETDSSRIVRLIRRTPNELRRQESTV
jgi:hypothetical protein